MNDLLASAARMAGPIVVVGRPRSGSRIVAELLSDAGVFMGHDLVSGTHDALAMLYRFVAPLVSCAAFPLRDGADADDRLGRVGRVRLSHALEGLFGPRQLAAPWGWKFCETALLMPLVKRLLPRARFVHVIRDGRDVCVSLEGWFQLTGPRPPVWPVPAVDGGVCHYDAFCRAVTFGDPAARRWRGIDLDDPSERGHQRYLLQMQSWLHCVGEARRYGRELGDDYFEVRYEGLCREPSPTSRALLDWAGLTSVEAVARHADRVTGARIGAWRAVRLTPRERRDLGAAVEHGADLLAELSYR
jgi:hypothetical protein